ncbi:putative sporulation protein YtxC [Anaerosalibacter bizertensis]|uniref:Sporulation protein YtxC n=1 Tax=Anaerosalibacter bizertensis TaxID=932217 RepID=A0A9Q4ADV1_9FIRM|nr:putative sporulation protein YtxC [Anaerosalibacter bizertensis]MBV1819650.1 putative sporulation protein YtxC [Bacteroidales bacterium MSK.15.36]MCB5560299.1 putative sporulation protein YtxC [Anaerosalibacter bizertensis]MCG4565887.1 putative sporulation protein YtxC [Anaerosalibacter bizertensis]MCG4583223.1 putative sporulation protein YtxC [Anaerosalibacter bizertensis]
MLSIGVKETKSQINDIFNKYDFGNNVEVKEEKINDRFFLIFYFEGKEEEFYNIISLFISEIIFEYYLKEIILKDVFMKYKNFNRDEKVEIVQLAYKNLYNENEFVKEKELIFKEVYDYISINDLMIVDGFVSFRLKSRDKIINEIIKRSIDEFSAVKEYREFINILQYFIDIQEPKIDLINVVIDDEYKLYDKENNLIDNDFFSDIISELSDDGINEDDILISSIITIAPQRLIIHVNEENKDKEIVDILQSVFIDKVEFCKGCNLCNIKVPLNKEK